MKKALLLIFALCAAPGLLHAEAEVKFTAISKTWIVEPNAHGIYSRTEAGLFIGLDSLTLTVPAALPRSIRIVGCRIGIAVMRPDGQWPISRWSGELEVNRDLTAGESLKLQKLSGLIPLEGIASLEGHFLVLQVRSIYQNREVTTYAHSALDMFASLPK